jgi:hypothetical protein
VSVEVVDERQAPFFWVLNDAMRILQTQLPKKAELKTAIAVLTGFSYLASLKRDGNHRGFVAFRKEIHEAIGVSARTLDTYVDHLQRLGLLRVENQYDGKGQTANRWVLVSPQLPLESATVAGGQPLRGGATVAGEQPATLAPLSDPHKEEPPAVVVSSNGSDPSGEQQEKPAELRFCRFLTTAAGEDPTSKRYSPKQLENARYLIGNKDHTILRDAVAWAHTQPYWSPKVVNPTTLRRWWDQLLAAYRAAQRGGASKIERKRARTRERLTRGVK